MFRWIAIALMLPLASGCATAPPDRIGACGRLPKIEVDGGKFSTTLSVLTYNVEGLPWPIRSGRAARLREITRQLAEMRRAGTAPDVILLQEAFTAEAKQIGFRAGYANLVQGPPAAETRPPSRPETDLGRLEQRKPRRGEAFGPLLGSGLYIYSDYPISGGHRQPFRRSECAGYDCLANKGVLHVRLEVPGVPDPVDIFNTHLNARTQSGVSWARSLAAHQLQVEDVARFIDQHRPPHHPLIFGGDFNMRNAPPRFEWFSARKPWPLVHQWCVEPGAGCDVRMSWDGDEPWMDTQDLQGFDDGLRVKVRPVRVEAMFDQPWRGRPLADHDGFLVVYRLSWQQGINPTVSGMHRWQCDRLPRQA